MNPFHLPGTSPDADRGPRSERQDRLRFMKSLVHDLNNALSVITIDMALIRDGARPAGSEDDLLDEIAQAATQASRLTGQIGRLVTELVESLPSD